MTTNWIVHSHETRVGLDNQSMYMATYDSWFPLLIRGNELTKVAKYLRCSVQNKACKICIYIYSVQNIDVEIINDPAKLEDGSYDKLNKLKLLKLKRNMRINY